MPFALITIGLLLLVSAVRNTLPQLAAAVKNDFSGSNNFFYWVAGLGCVGALGYIPSMRVFSRVFLALIIIVLALHNGGFFSQFMSALQSIQAPPASATDPGTGTTSPTGQTTSVQTAGSQTSGSTPSTQAPSIYDQVYKGMGLPDLPDMSVGGILGGSIGNFIGGF